MNIKLSQMAFLLKLKNEALEATQVYNYKRFYCDKLILSRDYLQKHKSICHGMVPSELMQEIKPVTRVPVA